METGPDDERPGQSQKGKAGTGSNRALTYLNQWRMDQMLNDPDRLGKVRLVDMYQQVRHLPEPLETGPGDKRPVQVQKGKTGIRISRSFTFLSQCRLDQMMNGPDREH